MIGRVSERTSIESRCLVEVDGGRSVNMALELSA